MVLPTAGTLRVCHILGELNPSGAETMLRAAAPHWPRLGVGESHILSTGRQVGVFANDLRQAGYLVHHVPFVRSPLWNLTLYQALRRIRPDTVHIHTEQAAVHIALASARAGCRRIRTLHNAYPFHGVQFWRTVIRRATSRILGVRHVAIGPSVQANEFRFGNRSLIIDNWLDTRRFATTGLGRDALRGQLGYAAGDIVLMSVGACHPFKNHPWILHAIAGCRDLPIRYLHCGTGQDESAEMVLAKQLGISDRCCFVGRRDDVAALLVAGDGYLMPSDYEGFGIAAIEALAMGLPCLLSDVPGLRDLRVMPGVRLFPGPRHYDSAGNHLRAFLGELAALRHAATSGREAVALRFGPLHGAARYAALYRGGR